jgi:hypothetical protein
MASLQRLILIRDTTTTHGRLKCPLIFSDDLGQCSGFSPQGAQPAHTLPLLYKRIADGFQRTRASHRYVQQRHEVAKCRQVSEPAGKLPMLPKMVEQLDRRRDRFQVSLDEIIKFLRLARQGLVVPPVLD